MPVRATAVNQPLVAFKTTAHPGALGRAYSMATIVNNGLPDTTGQVAIVAMKKAEDSDEVVLRLQERYGQAAPNVTVRLGVPVLSGREINAAEEEVGPFAIGGGGGANRGGGGGAGARGGGNAPTVPPPAPTTIQVSFGSYQPRSLALSLQSAWDASTSFQAFSAAQAAAAAAAGRGGGRGGGGRGGTPPPNIAKPTPAANATITLPYNLDGVSTDGLRADGDFDGKKHTLPAELFPKQLDVDGVPFAFGPPQPGAKNILVPSGQTITLPAGKFNSRLRARRLRLAATSPRRSRWAASTRPGSCASGRGRSASGGAGSRTSRRRCTSRSPCRTATTASRSTGIRGPGSSPASTRSIRRSSSATKSRGSRRIATIRTATSPTCPRYVFKYGFDLPAGTREIKLPNDSRVRIFAISVVDEANAVTPAWPLYLPDFPETGVSTETLPVNRKPVTGGKGPQR